MLKEVPESMEELKRKATNQSNWRERLEAVNELKNYDCEQSRSILTNLAIHDSVFVVQEAAFRAAQSMKITKNGQPIRLNRKPKGNLVKGINGKLVTVRNSLPEGYTLDEFKRYRQVLCANSFTSLAELSLHRAGKPALNYLIAEDRERVKGGEAACEALDVNSVFCYQPASSSCISMYFMLMYFFPPHWVPAT